MRPLTIFLSRLIGLFAMLVSLAMVLHRQYVETAATLIHDRPLLLVLGMISLIAVLRWLEVTKSRLDQSAHGKRGNA